MKRYAADITVTTIYTVYISANNENEAWDIAEDLDIDEVMDGNLVREEFEVDYVQETDND